MAAKAAGAGDWREVQIGTASTFAPRLLIEGSLVTHASTVPWVTAVVPARSTSVALDDTAQYNANSDAWFAKVMRNVEPRGGAVERGDKPREQREAELALEDELQQNLARIAQQEAALRALMEGGAASATEQHASGVILHECPQVWKKQSYVKTEEPAPQPAPAAAGDQPAAPGEEVAGSLDGGATPPPGNDATAPADDAAATVAGEETKMNPVQPATPQHPFHPLSLSFFPCR